MIRKTTLARQAGVVDGFSLNHQYQQINDSTLGEVL